MEYYGKLYGKIWNKYFDTGKTTEDFDYLESENKKLKFMIENKLGYEDMINDIELPKL